MPPPSATSPSSLAFMFRALHSRNYALFFTGQLISLIGTWLTTTTVLWLVGRLTNRDSFFLGMVGFAGQIPAFFLMPFAGVLVDRWNLHRTLLVTQTLSLLQSAALAALVFLHLPRDTTLTCLYLLLTLQGLVNAFDLPTRQAFIMQLVDDPNDLPNAIALNSSMFNSARLLGPAVAGILIAAFGEGLCFTLDAVSYLAVILGLLLMHLAPRPTRRTPKRVLVELKEGLQYAFSFAPIRALLLLVALVSLVGVPYGMLVPVFVHKLGGGPRVFGLMTSAAGAGALCGALILARRKSVVGLGRVIPTATLGFGSALIAFAYSPTLFISLPLMSVLGFCMVTQMASGNTMLQTIVDDSKRGRIMALYAMSFQGMMPLGSLLVGTLATEQHLGPSPTLALGGLACILAALAFIHQLPRLRKLVHAIYIERGILPPLPPIASALNTTAQLESQEP